MTDQEIVSFSEVMKFQTCKRAYYYNYTLGLRPIEMSEAISTGVKGHKLLQSFHEFLAKGMTKDEAHKLTLKSADKLMRGEGGMPDLDLLKAWTLVDNYIRATDFTAETLEVETRFLIPIHKLNVFVEPEYSNIQIGFTPDAVFKRKGGFIDVEDYKFVARAWPKSKTDRVPQLKLYQLFLEAMGFKVSRSLIRFFNLTTAKITEVPFVMDDLERQILAQDFLAGVIDVINHRRQDQMQQSAAPRTMNYGACQFCSFNFPCTLEAQGKSAAGTLTVQYKKSDYDYNS
jgi:hypothetical protein